MRALTRVEFTEGDLLRARDLEAALAGEARRRALHMRAVHRKRGVALGFAVSVQPGGRVVLVEPGFGYDRCGHEVFSGRTVGMAAPIRDGVYDLAIRAGRCTEWLWLEPEHVCDELLLARLEVSGGALGEPDLAGRRPVRGEGGRIGSGSQEIATLTTNGVNTVAAGFRRTPYYFVRVEGQQGAPLLEMPALEVLNTAPGHFQLKVGYAGGAARVELKWLGVEIPEAVTE